MPLSSAITACPFSKVCGSAVKGRNVIGIVNKKEIKSAMRNCIEFWSSSVQTYVLVQKRTE